MQDSDNHHIGFTDSVGNEIPRVSHELAFDNRTLAAVP